jgi:prepilin-type processing-associated H-X9-DG protein
MELLVVISLLATLIGILLTAVQKVRAAAARTKCANNLRQVAVGTHNYTDSYGRLPPAVKRSPPDPFYHLSWLARLLPYLDEAPLWQVIESNYAGNDRPFRRPRHVAIGHVVGTYSCPADPVATQSWPLSRSAPEARVAFTSYLGNLGLSHAVWGGVIVPEGGVTLIAVADGTSATILAGERPPSLDQHYGWWYSARGQRNTGSLDYVLGARELNAIPLYYPQYREACGQGPFSYTPPSSSDVCNVFRFWSHHPGGANFAFCDGSVRFLPYSADALLPPLATRAGGEVVSDLP